MQAAERLPQKTNGDKAEAAWFAKQAPNKDQKREEEDRPTPANCWIFGFGRDRQRLWM